ncbi:MAG: hypothetical protein OXH78_03200 [Acidimicrobiaceae bacterium]|nr:hypothetical protein [Acidimicrobiaceae bacterium]
MTNETTGTPRSRWRWAAIPLLLTVWAVAAHSTAGARGGEFYTVGTAAVTGGEPAPECVEENRYSPVASIYSAEEKLYPDGDRLVPPEHFFHPDVDRDDYADWDDYDAALEALVEANTVSIPAGMATYRVRVALPTGATCIDRVFGGDVKVTWTHGNGRKFTRTMRCGTAEAWTAAGSARVHRVLPGGVACDMILVRPPGFFDRVSAAVSLSPPGVKFAPDW